MNFRKLILAFSFLVVMLSAITTASFVDEGIFSNSAVKNRFAELIKRQMTFIHNEHGVDIVSTNPTTRSVLRVHAGVPLNGDMARIRFVYVGRNLTDTNVIIMRVGIAGIVEFSETNTTFNGYQPEANELVREFKFNHSGWRDIEEPQRERLADGTNKYTFRIRYAHPDNTNTSDESDLFEYKIVFADGPYEIDGTQYGPNQMKIDFGIHNWTYASNFNYLALETHMQSMTRRRFQKGDGYGGNCSIGETKNGMCAFSWVVEATADGRTDDIVFVGDAKNITVDVDDEDRYGDFTSEMKETAERLFFSFRANGAKDIIWDPVVETSRASTIVASACAVFLASFAALFF